MISIREIEKRKVYQEKPPKHPNGDMLAPRKNRQITHPEISCRAIGGPEFLHGPEKDWLENVGETAIGADDLEIKKEATVNVVNVYDSPDAINWLIAYFSDRRKLKVAVACFLKVRKALLKMSHRRRVPVAQRHQKKQGPKGQPLLTEDLLEAEPATIQYCQPQRFAEEISMLSARKPTVSRQSAKQVGPYVGS